ncbi:MAG TPA: NAD(+) diphosphatase [Clostridiales bacterium]|nr:NAD(+) diphosphatase [Clostridiales bacterium]
MLQEISPLQFDNSFHPRMPQPEDLVLCCEGDNVLVGQGDALALPRAADVTGAAFTFLFTVGGQNIFLAHTLAPVMMPGFAYQPLSSLRRAQPKALAFAAATGHQLYRWYRMRAHCGVCGTKTAPSLTERALVCPQCGHIEYPNIMPAVIVGIIDRDRLLLTRYANRPATNWALVAGYAEIGEPLEDTVRRETWEEVGLRLGTISYYRSQPWPFSGSLLMGFYAQLEGSDQISLNDGELAQAVWTPRESIDIPFEDVSLTNEMICRFRWEGENVLNPARDARPFREILLT